MMRATEFLFAGSSIKFQRRLIKARRESGQASKWQGLWAERHGIWFGMMTLHLVREIQ
jgi:hypothetical protein